MSLEVVWSRRARRAFDDLAKRDPAMAARLAARIELVAAGERGDLRKLQGSIDEWRLRVGTWRVVFAIDERSGFMRIQSVATRGEVYE